MGNLDVDGVWLFDMDRDLIRDRNFVRDINRVRHSFLNSIGDLLFDVYRVGLDYFYRVRLLNLDFNRHLNWVRNFLLNSHRIGLFNGDLHFLVDDDCLDLLVGAAEAGLRVTLGLTMVLGPR